MSPNHNNGALYRWSFTLIAEPPGPSQGDALEFIENLGFRTSDFGRVSLMGEVTCSGSVIAQFEVVGSRQTVERLRRVHDQYTRSTTPRPVPIGSLPAD